MTSPTEENTTLAQDPSSHGPTPKAPAAREPGLRLLPIGPLGRVTGSCTLVHEPASDTRILIDCGAYQGEPDADQANQEAFPFDPRAIHCVLLTHAHYDHCGRLLALEQRGFTGKVYATKETIELAKIVLLDSARIRNDKGAKRALRRLKWEEIKKLNAHRYIAQDIHVTALRSSHIVGAVSFVLSHKHKHGHTNLIFSGDVGNNTDDCDVQPFLRKRMYPSHTGDVAVLESTYGDRARDARDLEPEARRAALKQHITRTTHEGGAVLLPVFSIQRMQDVLYDLHVLMAQDPEFLHDVPVLVDGPMAGRANKVLSASLERDDQSKNGKVRPTWLSKGACRDLGLDPDIPAHLAIARSLWMHVLARPELFTEDWRAETPLVLAEREDISSLPLSVQQFRVQRAVVNRDERQETIKRSGPMVLLATAGMCTGGPIVEWLSEHVTRAESTVLFTGFSTPNSLAAELKRIAKLSPDNRARYQEAIQIGSREVRRADIRITIDSVGGYSGHADQSGLLDWAFPKNRDQQRRVVAHRVFLTHGSDHAREALREKIQQRAQESGLSVEVVLPEAGCDAFDVGLGESVPRDEVLGPHGAHAQTLPMKDLIRAVISLSNKDWRALVRARKERR